MKKLRMVLVMILAIGIISVGFAFASSDDIPRISVDELKKMIDDGADVLIFDAQTKMVYDRGHIKGAKSLPWVPELKAGDVKGFPKNKLTVTYCDCGPGEADSADLASQLMGLGFTNVKVLADPSVRGWMKARYPIEK